ncbi:MAG: hypothetical protein ACP5O8_01455 [Candidatus Aenigmatarchaeota archaeon]
MKKVVFFILSFLVFCFLTVSLSAQSRVSYVRFRFVYHLGASKTNDFYKIGEINGSIDNSNITIIGYPINLSHFYVCTYDEEEFEKGILASLIYSGRKQDLNLISFSARQGEEDYKVEFKQKAEGTSLILAFTNGTCEEIENKIYTIEKYGMPAQAFSVYPEGPGSVVIILRNDKILIKGSESLSTGTNKICVEYSGVTGENKPIIEVRRC